jgi:tetratricopeptide (TPR) repeat protein
MKSYSFLRGRFYLSLIVLAGGWSVSVEAQRAQSWGVESQNKSEVTIQEDKDIERSRVTIRRRIEEKGSPAIRRENIAFEEALRYRRLQKTEELIKQLEELIPRAGQTARRGELQMRLAELYFDRSRDVASQESESWRKAVEQWEKLSPEKRTQSPRPQLRTPRADQHRRNALNLYLDLERRSRGADAGRSQLIQRDEVLFYLGITYVDLGEGRRAEPFLEELLSKYSASARAFATRLQLADLYFDRGAFKSALPLYLNLAAGQASPELSDQVKPYVFYKLAWSYFNTGEYEKAVLAYKRTVELATGRENISFRQEAERDLARTFALASQYREGEEYFKNRDKDLLREHQRNSADLAASRGQVRESVGFYDRLIKDDPRAFEAREYALARLDLVRRGASAEAFAKELENIAENYGASSAWMRARKSDERSLYTEEMVSLLRRETKALHRGAQRSRQTARFAQVEPYYELYFKYVPRPNPDTAENLHEMRFYYAELLYRLKKFDEAEKQYAQVGEGAFAANAAYARILSLRELVAKDRGRARDLLRVTQSFIKDFPQDTRGSDLLYASAFETYSSGDRATSKETLMAIIKQYPTTDAGLKAAERYLFILEEDADLDAALKGVNELAAIAPLMNAHGRTLGPKINDFREKVSFKKAEALPESSSSRLQAKSRAFLELAPNLSRSLKEKALNNALVFAEKSKDEDLAKQAGDELLKNFPKSDYSRSLYLIQGEDLARKAQWTQARAAYAQYLELSAKDKALNKQDHETALWNSLLIQAHLENQVGVRVARRSQATRGFLRASEEFLKSYPRSSFRTDAIEFAAFHNRVSVAEIDALSRLPQLNAEEQKLIEWARLARILRTTAQKDRASVLRTWTPQRARALPFELRRVLARWSFESLESEYVAYQRLRLNFSGNAFARTLGQKTKALEELEKKYLGVVSYGDGDHALRSLVRLATLQRDFAVELAKAPVPRAELQAFIEPYEKKQQELVEECLGKAIEFKIAGSGLDECRNLLRVMDPSRITLKHETILSPGFIQAPVDVSENPLWISAEKSLRENKEGEFLLSLKVLRGEIASGSLAKDWEEYLKNLEGLQAWRQGANEDAVRFFREALEASGSKHRDLRRAASMNLASIYLQLGDYAEAAAMMEGLERSSPEAALIAGVSDMGRGRARDAARLFDNVYSSNRSRRDLLLHAALAWRAADNKKNAEERLKNYVELETPPASHFSRSLLREWRAGES